MMKVFKMILIGCIMVLAFSGMSFATVETFDDLITGQTSYGFDADNDGMDDVVFSTTDPYGFNTVGPGEYMTYIQQPGLEGTSLLNPDLRVDFLTKAKDYLKFGFALDSDSDNADTWTSFKVYDAAGNEIASDFEYGYYTYPNGTDPSNYPEGVIEVTFTGIAAYALFDFSSDYGRYIIDNFEGTYGTTEVPTIPEPATIILLGLGVVGLVGAKRKF
ncbi:MAG: PEP-CTERM sorting domain-containing protein [Deltaproteobacteria bacterium]|nr:PEP-CTERM sorting domain-containing protein [Deltaproteobacteria bacterium]